MIVPTLRQALATSPAIMYFVAFFAGLIMYLIFTVKARPHSVASPL